MFLKCFILLLLCNFVLCVVVFFFCSYHILSWSQLYSQQYDFCHTGRFTDLRNLYVLDPKVSSCLYIPHLISVKKLSSHWANHLKFIQKIRAKFEFGLATFFLFWSYALCFAKKCQYLRFPFNNQSFPLGNELKFICKSMNHTRQAELDIVFFSLWSYVPWFVNNTNFCFLFNNWSSP